MTCPYRPALADITAHYLVLLVLQLRGHPYKTVKQQTYYVKLKSMGYSCTLYILSGLATNMHLADF